MTEGRGLSGTGHLWLRDERDEKYHATECWCYDEPGRVQSYRWWGISWLSAPASTPSSTKDVT